MKHVTPEQDPEAVVGECLHRLQTAIADLGALAANEATKEIVLRDAHEIRIADTQLYAIANFTRSRLPQAAE